MWKRMQEEHKGQSGCRTPRTLSIFQTQQDSHTRELTETEAAHTHTETAQAQVRWGPALERGSRHKPSSLTQKLSPSANHPQRKAVFSSGVSLGIHTAIKSGVHAQL